MSGKVRCINTIGSQNAERAISQLIKEEEFYKIDEVKLENGNLYISFSESWGKTVNFVKQASKSKYWDVEDYCERNKNAICGKLICSVSLRDKWILFFEKRKNVYHF